MFKKICFCIILLALSINSSNSFAADERFSVDVNVDVTDSNASIAREKAMNEAHKAAVLAVTKRISTAEGVAKIGALNNNQLINFIKEVSIVDEKTSSVRYIANLRIVLNENILKQYMKEREIPLLSEGSSILVVPIFREFSSDKPMLWETDNLWKQAWDNAPNTSAVRFVSLPANGLNYSIMNAEKALALDGQALSAVINANNASDAYVLDATYDGIEGLIIRAVSYNGDSKTIRVAGSRSSAAELFANAVNEVKSQLEGHISEQNIHANTLESDMIILYNFERLSDWVAAERALNNTPNINKIETQAFANNKAQLKLTYTGAEENLLRLLNAQGYSLHPQDDYYILQKE